MPGIKLLISVYLKTTWQFLHGKGYSTPKNKYSNKNTSSQLGRSSLKRKSHVKRIL
jgi:hypothetical protein